MARHEADKEDLIADATALVQRAEYDVPHDSPLRCRTLTLGYRKDDSLSLYFDQDPFYQFDAAGRLRRGYVEGFLIRAQRGHLSQLQRHRTASQTTLLRRNFTGEQTEQFLQEMTERLQNLQATNHAQDLTLNRSVPAATCLLPRTMTRLAVILAHGADFLSDSIRTRS